MSSARIFSICGSATLRKSIPVQEALEYREVHCVVSAGPGYLRIDSKCGCLAELSGDFKNPKDENQAHDRKYKDSE